MFTDREHNPFGCPPDLPGSSARGGGEHRYCLFLCIAKPEQFPAGYRTGFNVNDLIAIPRWKCNVFFPSTGCGESNNLAPSPKLFMRLHALL